MAQSAHKYVTGTSSIEGDISYILIIPMDKLYKIVSLLNMQVQCYGVFRISKSRGHFLFVSLAVDYFVLKELG